MTDTEFDRSLMQAVTDYLAKSFTDERRRRILDSNGYSRELLAELADLGWFSLTVPDEFGGLGSRPAVLVPLFSAIGRALVPGPLLCNTLLPGLLLGATAEPAVAAVLTSTAETGTPIAFADPGVTEHWSPDIGEITYQSDELVGQMELVPFAEHAELLIVVAASSQGPVLCAVDPNAEGVEIRTALSADPSTSFSRVLFTNARVVEVLASSERADALIRSIRSWFRILIAAELSGIAQRMVDRTVEYAGIRHQFGRAIGSFQAIKHITANMHERTSSLTNLCKAVASDSHHGTTNGLELNAAVAKAYASEVASRVAEDAIQVHGGIGFTTEVELHWYYKRVLALRAWYGDEVELHHFIGSVLLDNAGGRE